MDQSYKDTKKRLFKKKYATSKALQAQKSFLKVQHTLSRDKWMQIQ